MYKRLYIIGNGFDLHYGQKTSLEEFGSFVRRQDHGLADDLETLFWGGFWVQFEEALQWLSPQDLDSNPFGLLAGIDKTSSAFDDATSAAWSYQYEAMRKVLDWNRLMDLFEDWVSQVSIPAIKNDGVIADDERTCYLTFNYTDTLESAFGIDEERILHIHGRVGGPIIVGHAPSDVVERNVECVNYSEEREIEERRRRFLEESEKPVISIIAKNEEFFRGLADVEKVIVAGFGFWHVDRPYITRICDALQGCAGWKVYQYCIEDQTRALEGIPEPRCVSFEKWPSC